jgi:hypothetical protein
MSLPTPSPPIPYLIFSLSVTLKTLGKDLTAVSASVLSILLSTYPSRVTEPFLTIILIGEEACIAYFSKPGLKVDKEMAVYIADAGNMDQSGYSL